jgi:adenosylcobinamide kinase / adenosylcobinamide-phosphate guanylyltransferase
VVSDHLAKRKGLAISLLFITGPVRSGKSRFAALTARESGYPVTYVATAARDANDAEWNERIERHRLDRPRDWATFETAGCSNFELYDLLRRSDREAVVLVDSLGTWFADRLNELHGAATAEYLEELMARGEAFVEAVTDSPAQVIVVSEETGWGIVPENAVARAFRDAMGFTNQRLARLAQRAYLVVCGYAIDVKSALPVGDFE